MRTNLKRRYYDHGQRCLSAICNPSSAPDGYLCPICLSLLNGLENLTLEHVPPRSQGGKILCLTCKSCNSRTGHTIDAALHKSQRFRQFLQRGKGAQRAKLKVDDIELNVDVAIGDQGLDIVVPKGLNNPQIVESANQAMRLVMQEKRKFSLTKSERIPPRAENIGYLKSAYLVVFAKFGYRLVLQPAFDIVRKQICEPEVEYLNQFCIYLKNPHQLDRGIYILTKPIVCILVVYDKTVIVLPWIKSQEDVYAWLASNKKSEALNFTISKMCPWPDTLELGLDCLTTT